MPERLSRIAGQVVAYGAFAAVLGYFSFYPAYRPLEDGLAMLKLSFSHGGQRVVECRRLTPDEIAALPPNERRPNTCDREREPVLIEMVLDGKLVYSESLTATGIARDGPSTAYAALAVPAGRHRIELRLRDTARESGFDYQRGINLELAPRQIFVVDFRAQSGGFMFPTLDAAAAGESG